MFCKGLWISGYIGENCHFATFRKTCEELALLGYTRNDVYLIDIDGNGKFPPAHVKCEFQIEADSSTTVVEHNLPSQVVSYILCQLFKKLLKILIAAIIYFRLHQLTGGNKIVYQ